LVLGGLDGGCDDFWGDPQGDGEHRVPSATLRKTSSAEACGSIQAVVPGLRSRRATL